jgi:hypothetical protein
VLTSAGNDLFTLSSIVPCLQLFHPLNIIPDIPGNKASWKSSKYNKKRCIYLMLKRHVDSIAVVVISMLLMLGFILYLYYATQPSRKPAPTPPKQTGQKLNWYMQFSTKQQKSTAYTEEPGAPLAANGKPYHIGGIAVHPRIPLQDGGKATVPIIPFGTVIHLDKPIKVQDREFSSMTVIDTGDVNYGLWPSHPYWVDIYWGSSNYYNNQAARSYGSHLVNYHWYEPWK